MAVAPQTTRTIAKDAVSLGYRPRIANAYSAPSRKLTATKYPKRVRARSTTVPAPRYAATKNAPMRYQAR